jgi:hypothetical protein
MSYTLTVQEVLICCTVGSVTQEGTVRTEFTHQNPEPSPHAYNDPDLDALAFLRAVMHATHLPMVSRIQAASALLPYTNSVPRPMVQGYVPCKIIIGGLGPSPDPTENHSQSLVSRNKTLSQVADPGDPQILRDYSDPPTPEDIQQIAAAVHRLRPDLAHLPIPEPRLCTCGHWMFGPCPLGERCRERSKLN